MKTFIPKEHQDLPDSYDIEVVNDRGMSTNITAVSHKFLNKDQHNSLWCDVLEIMTHEDELVVFPVSKIVRIKFDKNWSKIIEINRELIAKKEQATHVN